MNDTSTNRNAAESILDSFVLAFDDAADKSAVRRDYCDRYPQLAAQFNSHAGARRDLNAAGADARTAAPRLAPGTRLGPFRIQHFIAAGGMGEVYRARQEGLDRDVALKVIRRDAEFSSALERFEREQQVLARLHQTHIVPIHANGVENGLEYFAMHHIDGVPLHTIVRTAYALETSRSGEHAPSLDKLVESMVAPPPTDQYFTRDQIQACASSKSSVQIVAEPTSPPPAIDRSVLLTMSPAYFRSVADAMAQTADALQHAHDAGILHRDLKPSNLMVDRDGQCWIIDFGLAGYLDRDADASTPATGGNGAARSALTHGTMGTPAYMAPEQHAQKPERRSDVWGLGATLYELLTLRPAFSAPTRARLVEQIQSDEPTPPGALVKNVPPDLIAICRKALRKEPDGRYQTAREFADDLRRWLNLMPTKARPASALRRALLWARRNKGWATAMACTLLGGLAFGGALVFAAEQKASAFQARAMAGERHILVRDLQHLRLKNGKPMDWSRDAWVLCRQLAKLGAGSEVRNEAAATLAGLDARVEKQIDQSGSSVRFDPKGQLLLIGGVTAIANHQRRAEGARIYDRTLDRIVHISSKAQDGPVAFHGDGAPLQLVASLDDCHRIVLWDVAADKERASFRIEGRAPAEALSSENHPLLYLSSDGALAAAASVGEAASVTVWDTAMRKVVYRSDESATAIVTSPDRTLVALGFADGSISIRQMSDRQQLSVLRSDRKPICALSMQNDIARSATGGWLLAAGDVAGTITIWDCTTKIPRAVCRGSSYAMHDLEFSPDRTTIAAAGFGPIKLWDVASGQLQLTMSGAGTPVGVAFAPDGQRIAACGLTAHGSAGSCFVWQLERDRGIQMHRGLSALIEKVAWSADEQYVAAMSQDSRIGVWELKTGTMKQNLEAPVPDWIDNSAFAMSPDNRFLAYSGSTMTQGKAVLWNLETGKVEANWEIPPGMNNSLAFHPSGKLLQFQIERKDGKRLLMADTNIEVNPPVLRVRDLRGSDPKKPILEISEFNRFIDLPLISQDGGTLVLVGYRGNDTEQFETVKAYDVLSGRAVWASEPRRLAKGMDRISIQIAKSGRSLWLATGAGQGTSVIELPSGKLVTNSCPPIQYGTYWLPQMPYYVTANHLDYSGRLSLMRVGEQNPTIVLGLDDRPSGHGSPFSSSGTRIAWGSASGTVYVADLIEIQRRLTADGLRESR